MSNIIPSLILLTSLLLTPCGLATEDARDPQPIQIFILAGQSNMEGQGVVDLDHPDHYNGGKGTLERVMREATDAKRFAHLKNAQGEWVVRDDVYVRFRTKDELKRGGLSIGFSGYGGKHHIGPELQFGHVVGDAIDAPVLLVKTAWGGKSLFKDFRPPSAGGEAGEYYLQMVHEIHEATKDIGEDFPKLAGLKYEFAGFVWFQGWNDMLDEQARQEYEQNLVHLIQDIRQELKQPNLPCIIAETGNGGARASEPMLELQRAQRAAAERPAFADTVRFVPTTDFARPAEQSPNVGHGHHWFGNAESYFLIGDAMGRKMVELVGHKGQK